MVGLRDTLEPDPDNTGVGSFPIQAAVFLESEREFSCFMKFRNQGIPCPVLLLPFRLTFLRRDLHAIASPPQGF